MSKRTTAKIVADLRFGIDGLGNEGKLDDEAADRLAELDALRPSCPTCGGEYYIHGQRSDPDGAAVIDDVPCPNCVDGKVSIEQLAATWRWRPAMKGLTSSDRRTGYDHIHYIDLYGDSKDDFDLAVLEVNMTKHTVTWHGVDNTNPIALGELSRSLRDSYVQSADPPS